MAKPYERPDKQKKNKKGSKKVPPPATKPANSVPDHSSSDTHPQQQQVHEAASLTSSSEDIPATDPPPHRKTSRTAQPLWCTSLRMIRISTSTPINKRTIQSRLKSRHHTPTILYTHIILPTRRTPR